MAKVIAQIVGGSPKEITVGTLGELKKQMQAEKYTATVNGEPEGDEYVLNDYEVVNLAPAVKGA